MDGNSEALAAAESSMATGILAAINETQPEMPLVGIQPTTTPEPQTEQTAAPVQEAAPAEDVVQPEVPEGNKPEGQVPALPDTPEVKKLLEIYGGDLARAAKEALATNTRASQMAAKLREAGIDPKTLMPYPKTVEEPEVDQTLPVQIDRTEVERYVEDIISRDADFAQLKTQYQAYEAQKATVETRLAAIEAEETEARIYLKHPATAADSFEKERLSQALRDLQLEKMTLKNEKLNIKGEQKELWNEGKRRRELAQETVQSQLRSRAEEQANEYRSQQLIAQSEAEWNATFPVAIEMAMKEYKLPAEMVSNLATRARREGLAQDDAIEDIHGFVKGVAKQMQEEMVAFHRFQSATYATQANARTQQAAGPNSTVNTVIPPGQQGRQPSLHEHEASLLEQISAGMRAGGTL